MQMRVEPASELSCTGMSVMPHRPPWIENDDIIKTKTLIQPQKKGIQVGMGYWPAM